MKTPVITNSIFIDALAYDIHHIMPEMQAKIPARVSQLADEKVPSAAVGASNIKE